MTDESDTPFFRHFLDSGYKISFFKNLKTVGEVTVACLLCLRSLCSRCLTLPPPVSLHSTSISQISSPLQLKRPLQPLLQIALDC